MLLKHGCLKNEQSKKLVIKRVLPTNIFCKMIMVMKKKC